MGVLVSYIHLDWQVDPKDVQENLWKLIENYLYRKDAITDVQPIVSKH